MSAEVVLRQSSQVGQAWQAWQGTNIMKEQEARRRLEPIKSEISFAFCGVHIRTSHRYRALPSSHHPLLYL